MHSYHTSLVILLAKLNETRGNVLEVFLEALGTACTNVTELQAQSAHLVQFW